MCRELTESEIYGGSLACKTVWLVMVPCASMSV